MRMVGEVFNVFRPLLKKSIIMRKKHEKKIMIIKDFVELNTFQSGHDKWRIYQRQKSILI